MVVNRGDTDVVVYSDLLIQLTLGDVLVWADCL